MDLVTYAHKELSLAGMLDADSDYGDMLGVSVLELVEKFSEQGHSGYSAYVAIGLFAKVASYQPLTPITSDPSEWMFVYDELWQSIRRSTSFSRDGGKTWYDIDDPRLDNGDHHIRNPIKRWIRKLKTIRS